MRKIIKQRMASFGYALRGLRLLFETEIHGKFHILFAIFVIGASVFFNISTTEWCLVIITITIVISAEAFNSSIESLTDLVSPDQHPLAAKTKDMAAGAVLILAIGAAIIGCIIFLPKVYGFFLNVNVNFE
ncbi:MAG: diacylglycerol kinase family protein [Saprospiraceae bacterium]